MGQDSMSCEQRLQAVLNLQIPDRVPVCPFIYYFAAGFAGITVHELWSDPGKYRKAMDRCYEELGPWDVYLPYEHALPGALHLHHAHEGKMARNRPSS
jgi:hypothetical protein